MKKTSFKIFLVFSFLLFSKSGYSQTNTTVTNAANSVIGFFKKKPAPTAPSAASANGANSSSNNNAVASSTASQVPQTPTLTSYQNYDFVPGNNILFEDNFAEDQSGEFPVHWDLKAGQAILNMSGQDKAFFMTDGNYCRILPLMKNSAYLTNNFSVEFDLFANNGYAPIIEIDDVNKSGMLTAQVGKGGVTWTGYIAAVDKGTNLGANLPADIAGDNFLNKWHHIAIAYKNDQMKVYVDKYRVLIVPHCNGLSPAYLQVAGIGDQTNPIIFKNFKIADGVQMYMTGQKFTDAKIVTHGINFDVNKATIKPESMGTLNMIVRVMNDNADLKFEIDGHTDNTGTPAANLVLSQQRADAVKAQLIVMGIGAARLTSKGFGDTKPMADNTTLEGKANNRRVEFVKQ